VEFYGVGVIDRLLGVLRLSSAPSTINGIEAAEVPWVLRARVFEGIAGVKDLQGAWPFSELGLL
jgi:hypothetical protein